MPPFKETKKSCIAETAEMCSSELVTTFLVFFSVKRFAKLAFLFFNLTLESVVICI